MSTKKAKNEPEDTKTFEIMTSEELSAAADARLAEDAAGHSDLDDVIDEEGVRIAVPRSAKLKKPAKTPEEQIEALMKKGRKNGKLTQNDLKVLDKLGLSEEALDFCDELMTAIHEEIGF